MNEQHREEALEALGLKDDRYSPAERCSQVDDEPEEPITDNELAAIWLDVMNKVDIDGIPF